jgi:hypothetical protein
LAKKAPKLIAGATTCGAIRKLIIGIINIAAPPAAMVLINQAMQPAMANMINIMMI